MGPALIKNKKRFLIENLVLEIRMRKICSEMQNEKNSDRSCAVWLSEGVLNLQLIPPIVKNVILPTYLPPLQLARNIRQKVAKTRRSRQGTQAQGKRSRVWVGD